MRAMVATRIQKSGEPREALRRSSVFDQPLGEAGPASCAGMGQSGPF